VLRAARYRMNACVERAGRWSIGRDNLREGGPEPGGQGLVDGCEQAIALDLRQDRCGYQDGVGVGGEVDGLRAGESVCE